MRFLWSGRNNQGRGHSFLSPNSSMRFPFTYSIKYPLAIRVQYFFRTFTPQQLLIPWISWRSEISHVYFAARMFRRAKIHNKPSAVSHQLPWCWAILLVSAQKSFFFDSFLFFCLSSTYFLWCFTFLGFEPLGFRIKLWRNKNT